MWRERNGASEGEGLQSGTLDFHGGPIVPADMLICEEEQVIEGLVAVMKTMTRI